MVKSAGCLLEFWTLRVSANSRWALVKFSPFLACKKSVDFATKKIFKVRRLIK